MNSPRKPYAVVPVKDPELGKSRLAPLLDVEERRALCLALAQRTLEACVQAFGASHTLVVTASAVITRFAVEGQMQVVRERPGGGLNAAIALGAERARDLGASALLVVPADLALVTAADLREAAAALPAAPGCLLVPDRRHSGTNLMGLSPTRGDLFAFGEGSLERHARLAAQAGCEVRIHRSEALGLDLDLPEDYTAWRLKSRNPEDSIPEGRRWSGSPVN